MASNVVPFPAPAQQPGLSSFIIYDDLPHGCTAFEVPDDSQMPHLRQGDFVVIDSTDRAPMHGEIFLAEFAGSDDRLVEVGKFSRVDTLRPRSGQLAASGYFNTYWRNPVCTLDGKVMAATRWFDGPMTGDYLATKLKGRVIGIYQPDFRAALKVAA